MIARQEAEKKATSGHWKQTVQDIVAQASRAVAKPKEKAVAEAQEDAAERVKEREQPEPGRLGAVLRRTPTWAATTEIRTYEVATPMRPTNSKRARGRRGGLRSRPFGSTGW